MRELQERWGRTARRAVAALRHVDRPLVVLVVGLLALATLTTYTSPAPPFGTTTSAAATATNVPEETVVVDAAAPELEGLLDAGRSLGADPDEMGPSPDADVRELTPFEGSPVGDLSEDEVVPADLIVRSDTVDLDALTDALVGATHVAPAAALTAQADTGADEPTDLSLLGVDGSTFRPLAPQVTAGADAVWERFSEGDVLVAHEVAEAHGLELGSTLLLRTDSATVPVRIGAFAANGAPSIADVLVPVDVASLLGAAGPNTLIVAAGEDPESLGTALADATGGEVELRRESAPPVAERRTTQATPSGKIEPFSYTSRADGRISIHGDWVARNITRVQLPGMSATSCHRVMVPQLLAAVEELIERDLYPHLDPSQFAGCFVARHIDWNPSKPLSMHAWGLAIDFNTRDNWLGATPKMDRRVVEVFERWGFEWGGHWRRPDGMHFELARIVPTG
ncbi:MAG: M15 family metallopeptidase [Nitriliruptor sp.]|uniref:M15 family metallopeptidase n=1 Tax=Nitriliruptor sp. TaxID=2448056 RepID=UPI0034A05D1C